MRFFFGLIFCASLLNTQRSIAQTSRAFNISDLFNSYKIQTASISPDNRYAAIVIERPHKDQVIYSFRGISFRRDIWLLDLNNYSFEKILNGQLDSCSYWNPTWSPDSKHLAVLSTKGQDNIRTYIYDIADGGLVKVHQHGTNLMTKTYQKENGLNDGYFWLDPDNLIVSVLPKEESHSTFRMDYNPLYTIEHSWKNMQYNQSTTASTIDSDSLHLFQNDLEASLIQYNLSNQTVSTLDSGYFRQVIVAPSQKSLLVVKRAGSIPFGSIELVRRAWNFNHQIGIIDLNSDFKQYLPLKTINASASSGRQIHSWTSNSKFAIIKDSRQNFVGYINARDFSFNPFEYPFKALFQNDSQTFLEYEKKWYELNETDGTLKLTDLPAKSNKKLKIRGTKIAQSIDNKIVLSRETNDTGLHLIVTEDDSSKSVHSFNEWIATIKPIEKEIIAFKDSLGKEQKALLLKPRITSGKHPLVVSCYPGTRITDRSLKRDYRHSESYLNPLILVENGYFVLIPTIFPKSSEELFEYGQFVIPAVDALKDHPNIDLDRIALMGLSHGGYLVYGMIAQTDRFKSAIALAGISNAISSYGSFDIRYRYVNNPFDNVGRLRFWESGPGSFETTPYRDPQKYLRNSPILYTPQINTPLLIIQGDKDFVSIEQGEEMFTHLYRQGKKVRFLRFWGEGHNISAPKNIEKMWAEIFYWLERTLD